MNCPGNWPWNGSAMPIDNRMLDGPSQPNDELSLIGQDIRSLLTLRLTSSLVYINLHCNNITKIENLQHLTNLQSLDLSSNKILEIGGGLACLCNLRVLNLSCNEIEKVDGLSSLRYVRWTRYAEWQTPLLPPAPCPGPLKILHNFYMAFWSDLSILYTKYGNCTQKILQNLDVHADSEQHFLFSTFKTKE